MKKIIVAALAAIFIALPSLVSAGYSGDDIMLMTRLEVSKDNSTWVNYLAEENSGDQILTVLPGDTVYLRLKTWNTGDSDAYNVSYTGDFTNPQYLSSSDMFTSGAGAKNDLDGDETYYYSMTSYSSTTGAAIFTLDGVVGSSTVDTNYQSGGITATVSSDTPDQTIMLVTVRITDIAGRGFTWRDLLFPRAHADDSATTQARILVSIPTTAAPVVPTLPVTGPDPIQLIMSPVMRLCQ